MHDSGRTNKQECHRRSFLKSCAAGSIVANGGLTVGQETSPKTEKAIDFSRSYLYCTPRGTEIWVRPQIECRLEVFDRESQQFDEYLLSVVAKTGLTKNPQTGGLNPGYDYWIIFSEKHVYTRRTHTSSYFNNPTTLTHEEFGVAKWHLERSPVRPLRTGEELRNALESWQPLVARSEFSSKDARRGFTIEYPVKWADFNVKTNAFRVETGPVLLIDPNTVQVGQPLKFADFVWAHLDYHQFDRVRCLLDRPTPILTGATFAPPAEHNRQHRAHPALTAQDVKQIESRLYNWTAAPIQTAALRELLQTDHYSAISERAVNTKLFAFVSHD